MYKTSYVCDCCGAEMAPLPTYTLSLGTQSFCIQDQVTWHYCEECWENIKEALTKGKDPNILKKTVADLKEENKKLKKNNEKLKEEASWYQEFWLAMFKAAQKNREKCAVYSPFAMECCCENTNKDSLGYKQTTGI